MPKCRSLRAGTRGSGWGRVRGAAGRRTGGSSGAGDALTPPLSQREREIGSGGQRERERGSGGQWERERGRRAQRERGVNAVARGRGSRREISRGRGTGGGVRLE